jgi:hypothetical protein
MGRENTKRCSGCQQELPATAAYFHRNAPMPDGLHNECKICRRRRAVNYGQRNTSRRQVWRCLWFRRQRIAVLEHFSGGTPKCACCGEPHSEFVAVDHANGGGTMHRKTVGSGSTMWRGLRQEGFPGGYRVLCHNCKMSLDAWGYCPHQREAESTGKAG